MSLMIRLAAGLALVVVLAGCGNKGDLVKPGQQPPAKKTEPAK